MKIRPYYRRMRTNEQDILSMYIKLEEIDISIVLEYIDRKRFVASDILKLMQREESLRKTLIQ